MATRWETKFDGTSNFRTKVVAREEVVRVEGAKGAPIALQLRSGRSLRLPLNGGGPPANKIRVWIRHVPAEPHDAVQSL